MNKKILYIAGGVTIFASVLIAVFFVGSPPERDVKWGVNFSVKHATEIGLDWKEAYIALLDEVGVRDVKIAAHWDQLEEQQNQFTFGDLDWQFKEAAKRNATVSLVVGMKTPRWPECHLPVWFGELEREAQERELLEYIEAVVARYKDNPQLVYWQVENEPFFGFGNCPWRDKTVLQKEVELVRSLDAEHSVVVTDTGEFSFWNRAAKYGDIVGVTLYRKVFSDPLGIYINYPLTPMTYWRKAQIIQSLFGKETIGIELQTEPWGPERWKYISLEEQAKTMTP
ncbi:MAG: endo-1,4-beta-xylanase, partial [archaeon]|nr:endo-1,4-beta-xylanase [archaeon]